MRAVTIRVTFILFAVVFSWLEFSQAADESAPKVKQSPEELKTTMQWWVERQLQTVKDFQINQTNCPTCGVTAEGDVAPKTCEKNYQNVYRKKTTVAGEPWKTYKDGKAYIDVSIVFGYTDYGDEVDDKYTRAALMDELRRPCAKVEGITACGFKYPHKLGDSDADYDDYHLNPTDPGYDDHDDGDVIYRNVNGPTGPVTIRITIKNSSATVSEAQNRKLASDGTVILSQEQAEKTQAAEDLWFNGLNGDAAIVMYTGHFRGGGGPSMRPPKVNLKTRSTDYDYYRAHPDSLNQTLATLQNADNAPAIVGLFACYSDPIAGASLQAAAPKTAFALTGDSSQEANLSHVFALMDDVMAYRCKDEVMESFNSITKLPYDHLGPTFVHGLFP